MKNGPSVSDSFWAFAFRFVIYFFLRQDNFYRYIVEPFRFIVVIMNLPSIPFNFVSFRLKCLILYSISFCSMKMRKKHGQSSLSLHSFELVQIEVAFNILTCSCRSYHCIAILPCNSFKHILNLITSPIFSFSPVFINAFIRISRLMFPSLHFSIAEILFNFKYSLTNFNYRWTL